MGRSVKTELYKAVCSPMFWAALLIGTGIAMINVIENAAEVRYLNALAVEFSDLNGGYISFGGCSLFIRWIAVSGASLGNRAYYFLWPILAAMPFGWTYSSERKSGIYNQLVTRTGVKQYYIAKYIAVFVSGGLAVGVPVLLNLLVNALICPSIVPNVVDSLVAVFDGQFMSVLFYTHPWLHGLIWCGVDFLFGGAAACLCFIVGARFRHQVMVMLTPFALLLALDCIYAPVRSAAGWNVMLSPLSLASMVTAFPNPEAAVFSVLGLMVLLSFGIGWRQVVRHEQL